MESIVCFVLVVLWVAMAHPIFIWLYDCIFGTHHACTWPGWHNGKGGESWFDGCSNHSSCSKCGKLVMQDGQGNWFEF